LKKVVLVTSSAAILLFVTAVGVWWPNNYQSTATIFANRQGIIKPLLQGDAAMSKLDRVQVAKEMIYTTKTLRKVALETGVLTGKESEDEEQKIIIKTRKRINISSKGDNYIFVSYFDRDPERAFKVVSSIVLSFIESTSKDKLRDSQEAYKFIDSQVQAYNKQLTTAEEALKGFKARSNERTEEGVNRRIAELKAKIEELKLSIEESNARTQSFRQQINNESNIIAKRNRSQELLNRIGVARAQLDKLLLVYTETYPDVVSIRQQIDDLTANFKRQQVQAISSIDTSGEKTVNPLYEELRSKRSESEAGTRALRNRLRATEKLLEEAYESRKSVAAMQAEYSALFRDYNVTQNMYNSMLERKETARLSMTLDAAGQGVAFEVHEPASFPLKPSGLNFWYFAVVAPPLALGIPLGILFFYIQIDPRIRYYENLNELSPVEVIAIVPHQNTMLKSWLRRADVVLVFIVAIAVVAFYSTAVSLKFLNGV